ncbi:sterol desaturase family protein [Pseudenhygromyxa sp. WMMC2535]|uniref:sterol desaturase family protein n=1 Tax=Pseudenhygromyxa sp. WMMC2535 TaxID=2712867 RepID=UPI001552C70F|nr:sterol desaturase family protein [Pseudenhygromyxa sp. WMMC2535]NVB43349.1 sterol desaturase family protein [Pseudenhygromyxa sp. WMMC2535]
MVNLITYSIPIFFALIGIELLASRLMGRRVYRLNDSVDDLNCGIVSRLRGLFTGVLTFGAYLLCYAFGRETLGLPALTANSWVAWVVALIGVDLAYYWFHRLSHEVNFLWAAHVVHHQSEEYNLAVALRQSAFQGLFSFVFYLPLALAGVHPLVYVAAVQINTIYQFWIHTRLIGRMGPLEWVLNTPSHHRVHHGADPKYLDRNYAGMLIIWDRMFGSFQLEEEEPTYGTTKPLARWNPLWANFDYWAQLVAQARTFDRFADRVRLFFKRPGWRPEQPVPTPPEVRGRPVFDADTSKARKRYLFVQFVGLIIATVVLLFATGALGWQAKLGLSLWILITSVAVGVGFEQKRSFAVLEGLRLIGLPPLVAWLLWETGISASQSTSFAIVAAATLFAAASGLWAWLSGRARGTILDPAPAMPSTTLRAPDPS